MKNRFFGNIMLVPLLLLLTLAFAAVGVLAAVSLFVKKIDSEKILYPIDLFTRLSDWIYKD